MGGRGTEAALEEGLYEVVRRTVYLAVAPSPALPFASSPARSSCSSAEQMPTNRCRGRDGNRVVVVVLVVLVLVPVPVEWWPTFFVFMSPPFFMIEGNQPAALDVRRARSACDNLRLSPQTKAPKNALIFCQNHTFLPLFLPLAFLHEFLHVLRAGGVARLRRQEAGDHGGPHLAARRTRPFWVKFSQTRCGERPRPRLHECCYRCGSCVGG